MSMEEEKLMEDETKKKKGRDKEEVGQNFSLHT